MTLIKDSLNDTNTLLCRIGESPTKNYTVYMHLPFSKKHHEKSLKHAGSHHKQAEHPRQMPTLTTRRKKIYFVLICIVVLGVGAWRLAVFEKDYANKFYPGVSIGGVAIGGFTYKEAQQLFKAKADTLEQNGITITFEKSTGTQTISVPTTAVGLTADSAIEYFSISNWETDLQEAFAWGHRAPFSLRATQQLRLVFSKKTFSFSNTLNKNAVDSLLENELYVFLKKSSPAQFVANGTTVTIAKEKTGETINKEEVIQTLQKKVAELDTTASNFAIYPDAPKLTEAQLLPHLDFAKNFAAHTKVLLKYATHQWTLSGAKLVTWLTVENDTPHINATAVDTFLTRSVTNSIDNPPHNSRFQIKNNSLVEITPGTSGFVVDNADLLEKLQALVQSENKETKTTTITIRTKEVAPRVTKETVNKYHIEELVGSIRTNFGGSSADRTHNIKIGVDTINGILIAPGEEFSTLAAIGPVTEKEGYVKELVIKQNKTEKEFGGGLCQVATTLFRLALNAGLPITERMNHRFVVPYYNPPGLDATIYSPYTDFRFVNDTNNYLLLQGRVENQQVIMELYGKKDGRTVNISEPTLTNKIPAPATKYTATTTLPLGVTKCYEAPHEGVTADVLYSINYADGTTKQKNFHSVYQPWQKVCLVGTALPVLSTQ